MHEVFYWKKGEKVKAGLTVEEIRKVLNEKDSLLWVDIKEADDTDIDLLTNTFKFHPLTVEDCIMPNARTKIEIFPHYLFLNMFAMELHPHEEEEIKTVELDYCLGANFLVTVHSENVKSVAATKEKINKQSPIMEKGADFLLCSIIDMMVDNYFPIINMFDDRVDDVSDEIFKDPEKDTLNKIYNLKNEIMFLRRTIAPQSDTVNMLIRGNYEFITSSHVAYFRDVYDNLVRLNDIIGTSRDIITGALEAYNSVVSNKTNEVMKTLTVIATIVMPLTLIASIYGMNFRHMPELANRYGYPAAMGLMLLIAAVMLLYFKRKKWL
ncbi:MAG: magnesium/cobalt transporter CorA [Candidatus Omnitrophica bacterium]|nr:magnesium/cobalt transporter CorA [Candidatus Omnitrophota bacterium]